MGVKTYGNRTKIRSESELRVPLLEKKEAMERNKKKYINKYYNNENNKSWEWEFVFKH